MGHLKKAIGVCGRVEFLLTYIVGKNVFNNFLINTIILLLLGIMDLFESMGQIIIGGIIFIIVLVIASHIFGALFGSAMDIAEKEADKGNGSCLAIMFITVIVLVIFASFKQCQDMKHNDYNPNWTEPRHTYIQKPMKKNDNNVFFSQITLLNYK